MVMTSGDWQVSLHALNKLFVGLLEEDDNVALLGQWYVLSCR